MEGNYFDTLPNAVDAAREALVHLDARGYTNEYGLIRPPSKGFKESSRDSDAIDYLCSEWDYGWADM